MKFDRNIKKGDLVYFNEEYRRIFSDNALGIVVQEVILRYGGLI